MERRAGQAAPAAALAITLCDGAGVGPRRAGPRPPSHPLRPMTSAPNAGGPTMSEIRRSLPTRRAMLGAAAAGLLGVPRALAANSSWDAIAESGVLRFGVLQSHQPYHNLEGGEWT